MSYLGLFCGDQGVLDSGGIMKERIEKAYAEFWQKRYLQARLVGNIREIMDRKQ